MSLRLARSTTVPAWRGLPNAVALPPCLRPGVASPPSSTGGPPSLAWLCPRRGVVVLPKQTYQTSAHLPVVGSELTKFVYDVENKRGDDIWAHVSFSNRMHLGASVAQENIKNKYYQNERLPKQISRGFVLGSSCS